MLKNHIKLVVRFIWKHFRLYATSMVNLSLGFACALLLILYAFDESSYDDFYNDADKIARIGMVIKHEGKVEACAVSPEPLAYTVMNDFPEVLSATKIETTSFKETLVRYEEVKFPEKNLIVADSNFLIVFQHKILKGAANPLREPNQIVLTSSLAEKLFGEEDPLNRIVELDEYLNLRVSGVIEDLDDHSHLDFNALISWSTFDFDFVGEWTWGMNYTYVLFEKSRDIQSFSDKLSIVEDRYIAEEASSLGQEIELIMQPLTSIHLHSDLLEEISNNGNIIYVQVLAILAIFFLILFCTNYINSSIVISFSWYKQIGVMKSLGLQRGKILQLFLLEALVITWFSAVVALILALSALPAFNTWTGKQLTFSIFQPQHYILFALVVFGIGLLAGIYSSYHLSRLDTSIALNSRSINSKARNRLQKLFVAFQFVICAVGIISTLVIIDQLKYIQNKDLGYNGKNVLVIRIPNYLKGDALILKDKLKAQPTVVNVAFSSHFIGNDVKTAYYIEREDKSDGLSQTLANELLVDYGFLDLFEFELLEGRNFERNRKSDINNSIINESASRYFNWQNSINRNIKTSYDDAEIGKVIGKVKNFHVTSLHNEIEPLIMNLFDGDDASFVYVKATKDVTKSDFLRQVQNVYEDTYGVSLSSEAWLSDMQKDLYLEDIRLNKILTLGSIIILLTSGLGLYSLSSFLAIKRTKDFSIRRVFGASRQQVVLYHISDFLKLSIFATLSGWVIAYFIAVAWLDGFAYRTNIKLENFVITIILNVAVVLISVIYHSIKISNINPAVTLKSED